MSAHGCQAMLHALSSATPGSTHGACECGLWPATVGLFGEAPVSLLLISLLACAPTPEGGCDAADLDGDGLDGCAEAALGTDPEVADTDGDGLSDGDEAACVSDPIDANEVCYACGWAHGDPGDLEATGPAEGDTVANLDLVDQCEEAVPLWDLAGAWRLVFMTAEWCGACLAEARSLPELHSGFAATWPDIPFSPVIVLFQDKNGRLPDAQAAVRYSETVSAEGFPVLADPEAAVLQATPWDGTSLPGLCVLSPDMVMVECTDGAGKLEDLAALVVEEAGE